MKLVSYIKSLFNTPNFISGYEIEGEYIKILSTNGESRLVKNSKSNINKINKTIKENKEAIIKRIDLYEEESNERFIIVLIDLLLVGLCGILSLLSFFTGIIFFYILSILFFMFVSFTTLISGMSIYILAKYISKLKQLTGYREEMEIHFPNLKIRKNI